MKKHAINMSLICISLICSGCQSLQPSQITTDTIPATEDKITETKTSAPITISKPPKDTTPTEITTKSSTNTGENIIYQNHQYGFEIIFGPERAGYQAYTYTGKGYTMASILFALPTTSTYRPVYDPVTGELIPGMADVFKIGIVTEQEYERLKKDRGEYQYRYDDEVVGKQNNIYYLKSSGNDLPEDIRSRIDFVNNPYQFRTIKSSFIEKVSRKSE